MQTPRLVSSVDCLIGWKRMRLYRSPNLFRSDTCLWKKKKKKLIPHERRVIFTIQFINENPRIECSIQQKKKHLLFTPFQIHITSLGHQLDHLQFGCIIGWRWLYGRCWCDRCVRCYWWCCYWKRLYIRWCFEGGLNLYHCRIVHVQHFIFDAETTTRRYNH